MGYEENKGFDIIIGNPPYIIEVRENKNIFRVLKSSPSVGKYYEDKMDIFYFFIEYGIDLLKGKGVLGFIVQEYWMTRAKATKLRQKIFRETKPIEFVLFKNFKVFKGAKGQHNIILILNKTQINDNDEVKIKILNMGNFKRIKRGEKESIILNELNKKNSEVFINFSKKLSSIYSTKTDKVYILIDKITEKLEELKTNKYNRAFNLGNSEIQIGININQPYLHSTGEGIFVLSNDEIEKYKWTKEEQEILKPFYYAKQIDRYFYPVERNKYYLIYTPVGACVEIERYLLKGKIEDLLKEGLKKLKDFISSGEVEKFIKEFTPHLNNDSLKEYESLFDMIKNNASIDEIADYLNKIEVSEYPNIVNHLLKYKDYITSDHKPFGIHRARQPEWFEDNQKIVNIVSKENIKKLEKLKKNEHKGAFNLTPKEINQGLVSNPPEAYIWSLSESNVLYNNEMQFIKPFGTAKCIDRYLWKELEQQLIAYITKNVSPKDLEEKTPNIFNRLKQFENKLRKRREVIENKIHWTAIHWPRNPNLFEYPQRIIGVRKTKYPKFVVIEKPFYMDQSVFIIRLLEHKNYSPYYLTAILNSKLGWWWFYNQKRQGEQLQIDKEVLLNFPIPEIDFTNSNEEQLKVLKSKYENEGFLMLKEEIITYPSNSAVLHDFLSFLAKTIIELNQNKYLLELFIKGVLEENREEEIKVIKLLQTHLHLENRDSETRQKEIAKNLDMEYDRKIKLADEIIDQIVYHLYGLNEDDKHIINNFFTN